jgi:hypothetical protein
MSGDCQPYGYSSPFLFSESLGKSFRQQRPDGLLVSQEHAPDLVRVITQSLVTEVASKSFLLMSKQ